MTYTIRKYQKQDLKEIYLMMKKFYAEDPTYSSITQKKFRLTFHALLSHPERGALLVIEEGKKIIGYCLLINYWSNEFGGNLLHIDEFYIKQKYRRKGIATQLINYLFEKQFNKLVAIQIEVSRSNRSARNFYVTYGFTPCNNTIMIYKRKKAEK